MSSRLVYLHALSAIHTGVGQAVDVIDLPVAREKTTGWPILPASGIKGVLRDRLSTSPETDWAKEAFGTVDSAGALQLGDFRLLFLSVRSFFGTFSWVTSPLVLTRFLRDCSAAGIKDPFDPFVPALGQTQSVVTSDSVLEHDGKVYLEDLDLDVVDASVDVIADAIGSVVFPDTKALFRQRFALVSDDVFTFLTETATEVTARVALEDDVKTVKAGGLWYEEAVPAESIFYGPAIIAARSRDQAEWFWTGLSSVGQYIQVGGKTSVGKGMCRMVVVE